MSDRGKRIEEIKQRLHAPGVTPDPWTYKWVKAGTDWQPNWKSDYLYVTDLEDEEGFTEIISECSTEDIANLIAHAPEDLRFLLEEIDRLESEKKQILENAARMTVKDLLIDDRQHEKSTD